MVLVITVRPAGVVGLIAWLEQLFVQKVNIIITLVKAFL